MKLLQHGNVKCIRNPHGRLNTFKMGKVYKYQMVEYMSGEQYYRVAAAPGKYQTIDSGAFDKHFEKLSNI